ncbi:MAG: hypothetical protein L6R39_007838 [Caloplaca ligustica]|nr:MAG: hypothetical protein L6R39_007838 [Caloplaca ligustica]
MTDEHTLDPTELGYRELRLLFDYLWPPSERSGGAEQGGGEGGEDKKPMIIDAEDLLAEPEKMIRMVCDRIGFPYSASMLEWPSEEDHAFARKHFAKYAGYHQDALHSTGLRRQSASQERRSRGGKDEEPMSMEAERNGWEAKYGAEAAAVIGEAVESCREDHEYLRQFRVRT